MTADVASQITSERLTSLFRPRSVALVGASDKSTFSLLAYRNLVEFGLGGRTHLVNRRGATTHGQPTVTSCARIGEPVDVAYLMVPQAAMLDALHDAAEAGIRNACVLSSGYAEAGDAGRAAQAELVAHAASLGMVLLGPNHLGFANFTDGVPVCSVPGLPRSRRPGRTAVAERCQLLGHAGLRRDGQCRPVLPGHPGQRGDDHRRARARLPGRRSGDPRGGHLHGDGTGPGGVPARRAPRRRGGQGRRGAEGRQQRAVRPDRRRAHRRAGRRRPGDRARSSPTSASSASTPSRTC